MHFCNDSMARSGIFSLERKTQNIENNLNNIINFNSKQQETIMSMEDKYNIQHQRLQELEDIIKKQQTIIDNLLEKHEILMNNYDELVNNLPQILMRAFMVSKSGQTFEINDILHLLNN